VVVEVAVAVEGAREVQHKGQLATLKGMEKVEVLELASRVVVLAEEEVEHR